MTTILGTRVNADAIAKGMLGLIDQMPNADSYQGALAFGMLPAPLMTLLGKTLWEKAGDMIDAGQLDDADADQWVREVEEAVTHAMYRHAEMVV